MNETVSGQICALLDQRVGLAIWTYRSLAMAIGPSGLFSSASSRSDERRMTRQAEPETQWRTPETDHDENDCDDAAPRQQPCLIAALATRAGCDTFATIELSNQLANSIGEYLLTLDTDY